MHGSSQWSFTPNMMRNGAMIPGEDLIAANKSVKKLNTANVAAVVIDQEEESSEEDHRDKQESYGGKKRSSRK